MKQLCFAVYGDDGKIISLIRSQMRPSKEGFNALEVDELAFNLLTPDNAYIDNNGAIAQMPQQPSEHHVFNYTTKQWEDPRTPETEWPVVRSRRNQLLTASDWTQLPDVPLATKEAWAIYRQALRDITLQPDPFNIVWPVPPGGPAGESL